MVYNLSIPITFNLFGAEQKKEVNSAVNTC